MNTLIVPLTTDADLGQLGLSLPACGPQGLMVTGPARIPWQHYDNGAPSRTGAATITPKYNWRGPLGHAIPASGRTMPSGILASHARHSNPAPQNGAMIWLTVMQLFKLWAKAAASPPPSSLKKTGKKRNRALEQQRRKITLFQKSLHAEAKALHDEADRRRQDDPKARFNRALPTVSSHRLRAREIERIGLIMSNLLRR